ncbi:hypothetical protein [Acuticoccus sp. I52.16.1]|uniref:hypothetical protein n=1 Tax=Acuticoccus sp. I52.16.1 TaxID=2928472 RepID=UPI001FD60BA9|nr:hypothetical protein [Acuticoccus sp. I52.16.1]UOM34692.1 hypothetical protein MRB58_00290 [Acuticoccus sp. I52.16.1]
MFRTFTISAALLALTLTGAAAGETRDEKMAEEAAIQDQAHGVESIAAEAAEDAGNEPGEAEAGGMEREVDEMERSEDQDGCETDDSMAGCGGEINLD